MRESGYERGAIQGLELVKLGRINNAPDDFPHVILLFEIDWHDAIELRNIENRLARLYERYVDVLFGIQVCDDTARNAQSMMIVLRIVIRHPGLASMDVGAAQVFRADHFAGRGLHKRRATKKDRPLISDDDCLV